MFPIYIFSILSCANAHELFSCILAIVFGDSCPTLIIGPSPWCNVSRRKWLTSCIPCVCVCVCLRGIAARAVASLRLCKILPKTSERQTCENCETRKDHGKEKKGTTERCGVAACAPLHVYASTHSHPSTCAHVHLVLTTALVHK